MTMNRSKNSTFELRICGRSMILECTIFFSAWSCTGLLTCPICMKDTSYFRLKFGGKICYFDFHRCFLPLDHSFMLDSDAFKKGNIVFEGPSRYLSGPEIADLLDNLVLKENGEKSITGPTDVHYGNSRMPKH
jgi:hypothetical protein